MEHNTHAPEASPGSYPLNPVLLMAALFAATVWLFWPATGYDYISLDDQSYVLDNPHVQMGLEARSVRWAFTSVHQQWWLPLLWLSYMADVDVYGSHAFGHHLTNILLHGLNAGFLFLALWLMTGSRWKSLAVAALFAAHPLRAESVVWIAARKDVLSGFFFMLSLLAYVHYVRKPTFCRYMLLPILMLLGLLAKAIVIILPPLLLLLDYWPLRRAVALWGREAWRVWSRLLLEKTPLFVLTLVFMAINMTTHTAGVGLDPDSPSLPARLALIFPNYLDYLRLIFWPVNLSIVYPEDNTVYPMATLAGLVVLAGVSAFVFWQRRKRPYLAVGWLWFLVALFPVIRGVRLGLAAYADRFTYLPMIGLAMSLVWGSCAIWPSKDKRVLALAALVLIGLCAVATRGTLPYWRNSGTLFERAMRLQPASHEASSSYGRVLFEMGDPEKGVFYLERAVALMPDNAAYLSNLGIGLLRMNRTAEAIDCFRRAVGVSPGTAIMHNNLGVALEQGGFNEEALRAFEEAVRLDPYYVEARFNQGRILSARLERHREAVEHLTAALRLAPDFAVAWYHLGLARKHMGDRAEAIRDLERAVELNPRSEQAQDALRQLREAEAGR